MQSQTDIPPIVLFERLQEILAALYQRLSVRFALDPQPPDQPLQNFSSPDSSVSGSLRTFAGQEIDWLVYSWLNAPPMRFSTMRLTAWLNSQIRVPHLAFELGTVPQLFFYMDYVPRVDLWTDLNYIEQFYESLHSTYLELRNNPNLALFVSKGLYVRQFQSPAHLCFTCPATEESLSLIQTTAQAMSDRWLDWVNQAEPVPLDDQTALAKRDLQMRRISAERDPGNAVATKIFGAELANQLVQALWHQQ
jgi:hypothetical protein